MLGKGCHRCHGSIYFDSYLAQGETVYEFICINCDRTFSVKQFYHLGLFHQCCCDEQVQTDLTIKAREMMARIGFKLPS